MSDEDYITSVAIGFQDYVRDLKKCDNKWISTCAVFLEISHDLVEFINAYRTGDSIAVELGYQKHSSVWEVLGQNKYVEIFLGQQETMYWDSPFSRLQELRLNRVVRRYNALTGKSQARELA